jgi:hypothetical protein
MGTTIEVKRSTALRLETSPVDFGSILVNKVAGKNMRWRLNG